VFALPPRFSSSSFREALLFAAQLHAKQTRKGTDIPYISHLLAVTSIAIENGANETEAIAALLHDAVEDQGGIDTYKKIRNLFGKQVADI
jgi:(p)ppGpp synthase/HD superfamily hydrolase